MSGRQRKGAKSLPPLEMRILPSAEDQRNNLIIGNIHSLRLPQCFSGFRFCNLVFLMKSQMKSKYRLRFINKLHILISKEITKQGFNIKDLTRQTYIILKMNVWARAVVGKNNVNIDHICAIPKSKRAIPLATFRQVVQIMRISFSPSDLIQADKHYSVTICLFGPPDSGKTTLANLFSLKDAPASTRPTISSEFHFRHNFHVAFLKNVTCSVTLIDTAGMERFRSLTAQYLRPADAVLFVYDWNEKNSTECRNSLDDAKQLVQDKPIITVGNKTDLAESRSLCGHQQKAFWCSALLNAGVNEVFEEVIREAIIFSETNNQKHSLQLLSQQKTNKKLCCN
jgi:small GTP-binding protein